MQIEISPFELRELLRIGAIVPDVHTRRIADPPDLAFGDVDEAAELALKVTDLLEQKKQLEESVAVLESLAKAARPVLEAQAVIDNAAEQWRALDLAMRELTRTLDGREGGPPATRDEVAVAESELLRCVKALGSTLGEEGDEDLDPPC